MGKIMEPAAAEPVAAAAKAETARAQAMTGTTTLGEFLFDCLRKEGITEVFGVPGDYNFTLLDTLANIGGMHFVGGRNELGSGYAADAYARVKGISALITTFGVGEMSACNAIAGANSEHVPVIHIVGAPPSMAQQQHKLMHHTLMDGDFKVFYQMYRSLCAYSAMLTPDNAALEIPAAIRVAKEQRKPVYLVVATDLVMKPLTLRQETLPVPKTSSPGSLQAAVEQVRQLMSRAQHAVIIADVKTLRFGLKNEVRLMAEAMNVPVATTVFGKGAFEESHPQFIGVYAGGFGSQAVRSTVESADVVIAVGPVWADTNTANFTAKLNRLTMVEIQPDRATIGQTEYPNVLAKDLLAALQNIGYRQQGKVLPGRFPYDTMSGGADELLSAASYYPRIQQMLKEDDVIIAETGSFYFGLSQVKMPRGATYIVQGGWQSIGYATGAAFGAVIAAPSRRVLLFTGDGSLQLTVQEISSMLAQGAKPIIFVLNNRGYTIEKYLNVKTDHTPYNEVPNWSYTKLAEAFGGKAYTATVKTNGELEAAMQRAEQERLGQMCIIEMIVQDALDAPEYMHNMRKHLEQQEKSGLMP